MTETPPTLLSELDDEGVLLLTLNRPEKKNAFSEREWDGLSRALDDASEDPRVAVIVLTGAGKKAFCTGGNTAEMATRYAQRPGEFRQHLRLFGQMITTLMRVDKPVINRVNGLRIAETSFQLD